MRESVGALAGRIVAAGNSASVLAPIAAGDPDFDVAASHEVPRSVTRSAPRPEPPSPR